MAKLTVEEIKAKADEYARLAKQIERVETARERAMAPVIERHAAEMAEVAGSHDKRIEKLQRQADELRAEVMGFLSGKTSSYRGESELAVFGVEIGSRTGPRVIDLEKVKALCKKKGVDIWDIAKLMVERADKLLGKAEVDAISEPQKVPTRAEYLRPKAW